MGDSDNNNKSDIKNKSKAAMYEKYINFLRKHYTKDDPTHVLMKSRFGLVGKFCITDSDLDTFNKLYKDVIFLKMSTCLNVKRNRTAIN